MWQLSKIVIMLQVEEGQKHLFREIDKDEEVVAEGGGKTESTGSCSVCWVNDLDTMISPCNHVCLCQGCAAKVEEDCPICKGPIEERITVYIS